MPPQMVPHAKHTHSSAKPNINHRRKQESMLQSLKLGHLAFKTFQSSKVNTEGHSFAVSHKPRRVEALHFVKLRAMSNQSSSPSQQHPEKGGPSGSEILEHDDVNTVEKMTVQQLRSKLRSVGLPAKGRKDELISAFRSFLNREINGEDSGLLEDEVSSAEKANVIRRSSKRSSKKLSGEDQIHNDNNTSETSEPKRTKRKVKENPDQGNTLKVRTTKCRKGEELSVASPPTEGEFSVRAKRKVTLETASVDVRTVDGVDPSVNQNEPWTIFAHKKPQKGWIAYNPKTIRPPPPSADVKYVKLLSWNVNGLRALLKLGSFPTLAQRENFDVLCLQETKLQERDVEIVQQSLLDGYKHSFWTCSVSKLGYSGTAVISRIKPVSVRYGLGIADHDTEGRLVTVEFDNFFLLNGYVPNSGDGLRRLSYRITEWDPSLGNYMKELEKSKPVILTGDLNCAHEEIDIYNPAGNKRSAGFTIEERQSFETNFLNRGFVDTFRRQHPGVVGYTYWGYRHGGRKTNRGWRLDYFLVSESIADKVHDSYILPDVTGSDHSPIGLIVKL